MNLLNRLSLILPFLIRVSAQDIKLQVGYQPCVFCVPLQTEGQWTQWSQWTLCEDTYVSSQSRTRQCTYGTHCQTGDAQEARPCLDIGTPAHDDPIRQPSEWTQWSQWTTCSDLCSPTATQSRSRSCNCAGAITLEGCHCIGYSHEERACPVAQWAEWSNCNASCGSGGTRTRVRMANGTICAPESGLQREPCNSSVACPVPCTTCTTNICSLCPVNYPLPCYTCLGSVLPNTR
ncbi:Transmembrane matrix receptor MUP-4-like isoform X3 [Aphelenchoides besseyi]|nr:Transmembrane matrix receptor MUP-4-like isoform X3 [Aphelenchoides besseyi]